MNALERIVAAGIVALSSATYAGCAAHYKHVKSAEEIALSEKDDAKRKQMAAEIVAQQEAMYDNIIKETRADNYISVEDMQQIGRHWRMLDEKLRSNLWDEHPEEAKELKSIQLVYEAIMEHFARNAPMVYHAAVEVKEKLGKNELRLMSKGLFGEEFPTGLTTAKLEEVLKDDKHSLYLLYSLVEEQYAQVQKGMTRELVVMLDEKYFRLLMNAAGGQFGSGNYRIDSGRWSRLNNGVFEDKEFTGNWGLRCYAPRGVNAPELKVTEPQQGQKPAETQKQ